MSLKHIVVSILFVFFSIYIAFLNPHESTFHLTQNQAFKLPTVILLLAAVFSGVLISVVMFWTFNLKNTFSRWKTDFQKGRVAKKHNRIQGLFKKAENFFLCGRLDKASTVLDKVLDAVPGHVDALSLKGKLNLRRAASRGYAGGSCTPALPALLLFLLFPGLDILLRKRGVVLGGETTSPL